MKRSRYSDGVAGFCNCKKCGILHQKDEKKPCLAGGNHESKQDSIINSIVLPYKDAFAFGKPFLECAKCGGLYGMKDNIKNNSCPTGGNHEAIKHVTYTLATNSYEARIRSKKQRELNTDFSQCVYCGCIFNTKENLKCHIGYKHKPADDFSIYLVQFKDYSPWQKVFMSESANDPFPPFNSSESLRLAYEKFNDNEFHNKTVDLRTFYRQRGSNEASTIVSNINSIHDHGPPDGVNRDDWDIVYHQLHNEAMFLHNIFNYYSAYQNTMERVFIEEGWQIEQIKNLFAAQEIIKLDDGLEFLDIIFGAFGFVFSIALEGAGEEISDALKELIQGAIELTEEAVKTGLESEHASDWDVQQALYDTYDNIYTHFKEKFDKINFSTTENWKFIVSDWERMQKANELIGDYTDNSYTEDLMKFWESGYKVSLFQTIFPARFSIFNASSANVKTMRNYSYRKFIKDKIEPYKHAIHYYYVGADTEANRFDSITAIMKREVADVLYISNRLGFTGTKGKNGDTYLPSECFMNKLKTSYNKHSINLDALFNNYGGWEKTPRIERNLISYKPQGPVDQFGVGYKG